MDENSISYIRHYEQFYMDQLKRVTEYKIVFSYLDGKTILLTGATGMLGLCLIDVIASSNRILRTHIQLKAFSRNKDFADERLGIYQNENWFEYYEGDCTRMKDLELTGRADIIIHCADNMWDSSESEVCVIKGQNNLLEYAASVGVSQYVLISTSEVYGNSIQGKRTEESDKVAKDNSCTEYVRWKIIAEKKLEEYAKSSSIGCLIFRPAKIYGPTSHANSKKAISLFIRRAAQNEWIEIRDSKNPVYSYIYITDAAYGIFTGVASVFKKRKYEIFNLSNENTEISIKELAEYLSQKYTCYKGQIRYEYRNSSEWVFSDIAECLISSKKLRRYGWVPHVSLEDGIDSTIKVEKEKLRRETLQKKELVRGLYNSLDWKNIDIPYLGKKLNKMPIFFFWWQGEEYLEELCRVCLSSLRKNINLDERELVVLTKDNLAEWVTLTPDILYKHEKGLMTTTHLSDILRCELLYRYGGMWVDSTILATKEIPDSFFESGNWYSFRGTRAWDPTDVSGGKFSGYIWFVPNAKSRLFEIATKLFYAYWGKYDELLEYFLINYFLTIAVEEDAGAKKELESIKEIIHIHPAYFMGIINNEFDSEEWNRISGEMMFLKLQRRYSVSETIADGKESYWGYLRNKYLQD